MTVTSKVIYICHQINSRIYRVSIILFFSPLYIYNFPFLHKHACSKFFSKILNSYVTLSKEFWSMFKKLCPAEVKNN